ncbi:MAG: type II secretion system F family protein [Solirubrobacterales bacterium]
MSILIAALTFLALAAAGAGIRDLLQSNYLTERMRRPVRKRKQGLGTEVPWKNNWFRSRERGFNWFGMAGGMLIGAVWKEWLAAFLLGTAGFYLLPIIKQRIEKSLFRRQFRQLFPRAVWAFASAARTTNVADAVGFVAENSEEPVRSVFLYIDTAVKNGLSLSQAFRSGAQNFQLRELEDFAESIRVLTELGGGEQAGELLESSAEEVRFEQRHRLEIKSLFGEMQAMMVAASLVPLLVFGLLALDAGSDYHMVIVRAPGIFVGGIGVLVIGWAAARWIIRSAAQTL